MKLGYQRATINFCMDLTSPNAPSLPVANLLVGEADGRQVAAVAVLVPDQLDPISKAVLNDTHQLIRKYVDEAFEKHDPRAPLGDVLQRVYHSLRNTMHVSAISEPAHVEVASVEALGPMVVQLVHEGMLRSLFDAGFKIERALATPRPSQPLPTIHNVDMPSSYLWAPPAPGSALAAAG
jgi:hypothetical protein